MNNVRSTQDLLDTLNKLSGWNVSVVAMSGMTFELSTPHGRMMATLLAGIAQFERDLISERVKSGLAAAKARGKKLGRQPGQRPKSDKLAPKVLEAIEEGRSYRWIARDLGISKNTVGDIVKRDREAR
jgi:DNA invertase Pin-like site-specific DNA recombinase